MTTDELIAALEDVRRLADNPEGFYTTDELSDILGIGLQAVRRRLKAARKADRLEVSAKVITALDGSEHRSPAYRIKPAA